MIEVIHECGLWPRFIPENSLPGFGGMHLASPRWIEFKRNLWPDMQWWLLQKLNSKKAENRREGVQLLGSTDDPRNVAALKDCLNDRDAEVRLGALKALVRIKNNAILPILRASLNDPDPSVREVAAGALMVFNDHESIPHLVSALSDGDVSVRWRAAKALDALGWSPSNARECAQHAVAAGEFRRASAVGDAAIEPLTAVLRGQHSHTRHGALEALAQIDNERVFPLLLEALRDRDSHVRLAAAELLSGFPDPKTVEVLVACLGDGNVLLRAAAASSLGKLGDPRAVEALTPVLRDTDWSVRKAAVDALGLLRAGDALPSLSDLLGDPDSDVREAVSIAFGRIGDRRAIEGLVASLADAQISVRQATAAALRRIDPNWSRSPEARRAISRLEAALEHRDHWVRHAAASALRVLREADEIDASLRQSRDRVLFRRQAVVETLFAALQDEDRDLRLAAVEALGRMQESGAAGQLRACLNDADPWVRSSAEATLRSFRIAPTVPPTDGPAARLRNLSLEPNLTLN